MIQKKKFSDAIAANISVVGGLLSLSSYPKYRGSLTGTIDFNNVKELGYYLLTPSGNTYTNKPSTLYDLSVMHVYGSGSTWVVQDITERNSNKRFRRIYVESWTEWKEY